MVFTFDHSLLIEPYYHEDNIFMLTVPAGMPFAFEQTSIASPVQFDVFDKNGNKCGYVRYRSGCFRVDVVKNAIYKPIFSLEDESLEEWPDNYFMSIAARVLDAYFKAMYC